MTEMIKLEAKRGIEEYPEVKRRIQNALERKRSRVIPQSSKNVTSIETKSYSDEL